MLLKPFHAQRAHAAPKLRPVKRGDATTGPGRCERNTTAQDEHDAIEASRMAAALCSVRWKACRRARLSPQAAARRPAFTASVFRPALHAAVVMIAIGRAVCARARAAEVERIPSRLPLAWLAGGGAVPPPGTQTTVAQRPPPRAERVGRTMIVQQLGTSSGRARAQSSVAADCNLGWRRAAAHYAHGTVEDMGL